MVGERTHLKRGGINENILVVHKNLNPSLLPELFFSNTILSYFSQTKFKFQIQISTVFFLSNQSSVTRECDIFGRYEISLSFDPKVMTQDCFRRWFFRRYLRRFRRSEFAAVDNSVT